MIVTTFVILLIIIAMDTVGNIGKLTEVYMIAGSEQIAKSTKQSEMYNSHFMPKLENKK